MVNNEIQEFAPVIIPTLCRYNHFKACLESLMRCVHADKTDVYIGLDYPAKEEHWEGYDNICKYLESIANTHKFKSLNVFKRERNYGLGIDGNYYTLLKHVLKFSDIYIFSEDDNIFAPAFLDYCNKGLCKFKEDKSVIGICGYRNYYNFKFDNNTFAKQGVDFVAWGYASWKDRRESFEKITPYWFRKKFSLSRFFKFCKTNGNYRGLCWLQYCLRPKKNFILPDDGISVYMGLMNKYSIMPCKTMVRNIGVDGSGVHFKKKRPELNRNLDEQEFYGDSNFCFIGSGDEYYEHNMMINVQNAYKKIDNLHFPLEIIRMIFSKIRTALNR